MRKNISHHSIRLGLRKVDYLLQRKPIKNINMKILVEGKVYVSAPLKVERSLIENFIVSKSGWILKHLERLDEIRPERRPLLNYTDGENLAYLGYDYSLRLEKSGWEAVYLKGDKAYLQLLNPQDLGRKKKMLENWYEQRREEVFKNSLARNYPLLAPYGVDFPDLSWRKMSARWGSCHVDQGKILLNSHLIMADLQAIDYVVLHELVHFIHPNHSPAYYQCLTSLMPDWKRWRKYLNEYLIFFI